MLTGLLVSASAGAVSAQEAHLELLAARFQADLTTIAAETPGVMGISIVDLTDGRRFGVNEEMVFPQGSSIKVAILVELYRRASAGDLRLDERVPVRAQDRAGGSGILQRFGDGTSTLSLRDLAVLMIVLSDNTATNMLTERVGMEGINRTVAELGLPSTRMQRIMIRPQDSAAGRENVSTPAEAADLMARIHRCDVPMSRELCADLRRILEIPKAVPGSLPSDVPLAWKGGSITGVRAGWGIVGLAGRPYAVGMMVNYGDTASASRALDRVADAAFDYFGRLAGATPHGARVPLRHLEQRATDTSNRP